MRQISATLQGASHAVDDFGGSLASAEGFVAADDDARLLPLLLLEAAAASSALLALELAFALAAPSVDDEPELPAPFMR